MTVLARHAGAQQDGVTAAPPRARERCGHNVQSMPPEEEEAGLRAANGQVLLPGRSLGIAPSPSPCPSSVNEQGSNDARQMSGTSAMMDSSRAEMPQLEAAVPFLPAQDESVAQMEHAILKVQKLQSLLGMLLQQRLAERNEIERVLKELPQQGLAA